MAAQDALRRAGLRASVITVPKDATGDERLRAGAGPSDVLPAIERELGNG